MCTTLLVGFILAYLASLLAERFWGRNWVRKYPIVPIAVGLIIGVLVPDELRLITGAVSGLLAWYLYRLVRPEQYKRPKPK